MRPFTVEEILKAVGGTLLSGQSDSIVYRICTDSRKAQPGDLFFPIIGEKNDGHDYLKQVLEAGCRTIIVSDESKVPKQAFSAQPGDADIICVTDTTAALQDLSSYYLDSLHLKKKFAVTITRTGSIVIEAETADEALDKVLEMTTADIDKSADGSLTGWEPSDVEEIKD